MKEIFTKFADNKYTLIIIFFLWSKCILYTKLGVSYFDYTIVGNDFFSKILYPLNPFYLDLVIVLCVLIQNRISYFLGILLCLVQIFYAESISIPNHFVSLFVFIWLIISKLFSKSPQIFIGRIIVSFIFARVIFDILTPDFLSWEPKLEFLTFLIDIENMSYLSLIVKFSALISIAILLLLGLGISLPIASIFGTIVSVVFGLFDVLGPMIGLLLTLVLLKFHNNNVLTVYFDQNCGICMKVYRFLRMLNSSYLQLSYLQENDNQINRETAYTFIASRSAGANYYGYDTYCEIVSRIPILSCFYPFMKLESVAKIGRRIYLRVAKNRLCNLPQLNGHI